MIDTTTVQRSSPLQPGLWRSDPILERYVVPATGSATFEVHCGDQLTIIDPEGGQPCELIAFDSDGKPNPEGLSDRASVTASGFHQMISSGASGSERCLSGLAKRNIDVSQARALPLFGNHTQANEQAEFVAQSSLLCIVCAPGDAMAIDGQMPPTGLKAIIRRAQIVDLTEPRLPDPLADPRLDFRIKKCTADQYTVRAGEFIQIIDVAGRECSDFLALSAPALDRGSERHIDMTTTRTLIGSAYPGPGLFSKYFDRDMNPLVEVVRDTCGRHDTFGLARGA